MNTTGRLAAAGLVMLAAAAAVDARDGSMVGKKVAFDISAQPMLAALVQFSQQSGLQVAFPTEDAEGIVAPTVAGEFTPAVALNRLLEGSGLRYELVNQERIVAIRTAAAGADAEQADQKTHRSSAPAVSSSSTAAEEKDSERTPPPEVLVTATRIDRSDFDAPTPVMALDADALRQGARPNIAAALNDLPQFKPSVAPQSNGGSFSAGTSSIDMRGLGVPRTLVLMDGRRLSGDNDLSLIPSVLVSRIDAVTGSASAAWGSGAVAGVVNVVLDNRLEGLRVAAQGSLSGERDDRERRFELAGGTGFADDKGHVLFGGEFVTNDGLQPKTLRPNAARWAVVPNAAFTPTNGQSRFILAPDVGIANVSPGGLILSGVNAGKTFNPDGTLRPYNLGTVSGTLSIGGEAPSLDDVVALVAPYSRYAVLGRTTYQLTDTIRFSADVRHARSYTDYDLIPDASRGNISISVNNAFLPAAVRSQMVAAGQTSFTMGRFNTDFANLRLDAERVSTQGTLALDGQLAQNWRWSGYFSHGEYNENYNVARARITANFAKAVDAVINPATGQPVCRVNIDTNPANDDPACVPINLFGEGVPSQQARDYATGNSFIHTQKLLEVGGLSLRGEPFELPAGSVSVAVGAEARHDTLDQRVSDLDRAGAFALNNFSAARADNTTKEGFSEVLIPLVKDVPLLRLFEFNGAARYTDDATGPIWSWKLGLVDKVSDGLQFRIAHSRDIRAPDLNSLFGRTVQNLQNISDPVTSQSYFVAATSGSNPLLEPEASLTTTVGFTISPSAVPGFRFSADYFDIDVGNAISTISAQDAVTRCFNGNQTLCNTITRGSNGLITAITANLVNLTEFKTSGVDAELEYALPMERFSSLPGVLHLRNDFTWVKEFSTNDGVTKFNYVGSQGTAFNNGVPRARLTTTLAYEAQSWQTNLRARYTSAGYYDGTRDIQNNRIPAYVYFDLGFNVKIPNRSNFEVYGSFNNLFDKEPPIESRNSSYDVIGRYFTIGARARF